MKTIIHKILFIILLSAFIVHPLRAEEKIIIIEQITFTDEQTVTIGSGESTVSAEVTYTPPGIPFNAEYYIELINSEIKNEYDAQIYVQQITPTAITFVIPENTLTQGRTFIIRGIPPYMTVGEAEGFAAGYAEAAGEAGGVNRTVIDKLILKSCKSAVKAHDKLSELEISELMAKLSECDNPYSCPHGRPTFIKVTAYDIERSFRRK